MNIVKIANDKKNVVKDYLEGIVRAHPDWYVFEEEYQCIKSKKIKPDSVVVIACGGGGGEPYYPGIVGEGMADAVCMGKVFTAPSAYHLYEVARKLDQGKGILFVTCNFAGDYLNTDMAIELLTLDGKSAMAVYVNDDIGSAPVEEKEKRGGITGLIWAMKIAAAAARSGCDLKAVSAITQKAIEHLYTLSVIFETGYMPKTGKPMFSMPHPGEIEFGMGFSGEPGLYSMPIPPSKELAQRILDLLLKEIPPGQTRICLMVNSYGFTGSSELYILTRDLLDHLEKKGISVYDVAVDYFMALQGMSGVSVTLFFLPEELKGYYDMPAKSVTYTKEGIV